MAKRTIGYYKDASKAPLTPVAVSTFLMFKDYSNPTAETAEPIVTVDAGSDERLTLSVEETERLIDALQMALDDMPRLIDAEVANWQRTIATRTRNAIGKSTQEVK